MGELIMGWFPFEQGKEGTSGSLVKHGDFYRPSDTHGSVVCFSNADVQNELDRVGEPDRPALPEVMFASCNYLMGIGISLNFSSKRGISRPTINLQRS